MARVKVSSDTQVAEAESIKDPDAPFEGNLVGWSAVVFGVVAALVSFYHFFANSFAPLASMQHRTVHVASILVLVFMIQPFIRRRKRTRIPLIDIGLILIALSVGVYTFTMIEVIAARGGSYTLTDTIFGGVLILLILEAARRTIGWPLVILTLIFLAYASSGEYLPGVLYQPGLSLERIINHLYITTEGVFGLTTGVSATYVFMFIIFGAVLKNGGMGEFFNKFALAVAGRSSGGPAKVAVLSSGLLGSISGSAASNVVTTGSFTIPLMKRVGYPRTFAAAAESAASTGGQILPPVMGAGAFLLAQNTAIPYREVAFAAIIPALLFYLCIWMAIHFRARKEGLGGLPRSELPQLGKVMRSEGHLVIPLLVIIYLLVTGYTPLFAAAFGIVAGIVMSWVKANTRLGPRGIIKAFIEAAQMALSVSIACITVGIIAGVVSLTGVGSRLGSAILSISGGNLLVILLLVMILSIVMGMGLPTSAAYIIAASVSVSALTGAGIEPLPAHLFVFYFAILAGLTPPVAITSFVAAAIAHAPPLMTSLVALRLALAGFIVPFMFVYAPELLLRSDSIVNTVITVASAVVGITILAAAFERYWVGPLDWHLAMPLGGAAVLLVAPGWVTDVLGFSILVGVSVYQFILIKRSRRRSPTAAQV